MRHGCSYDGRRRDARFHTACFRSIFSIISTHEHSSGSALLAMSRLMIGGRCHDAFQKAFRIVFWLKRSGQSDHIVAHVLIIRMVQSSCHNERRHNGSAFLAMNRLMIGGHCRDAFRKAVQTVCGGASTLVLEIQFWLKRWKCQLGLARLGVHFVR